MVISVDSSEDAGDDARDVGGVLFFVEEAASSSEFSYLRSMLLLPLVLLSLLFCFSEMIGGQAKHPIV